MYRCPQFLNLSLRRTIFAICATALYGAATGLFLAAQPFLLPIAHAQLLPARTFPEKAQFASIDFAQPPLVTVERGGSKLQTRLAPGARIRDAQGMLVMSGTLLGYSAPAMLTVDTLGQPLDVWILSEAEVQKLKPREVRNFTFTYEPAK